VKNERYTKREMSATGPEDRAFMVASNAARDANHREFEAIRRMMLGEVSLSDVRSLHRESVKALKEAKRFLKGKR
jgi:hypothetical protein